MVVSIPVGSAGAEPMPKFFRLSYTEDSAMEYLKLPRTPDLHRESKSVSATLAEAQRTSPHVSDK